MVRLIQAAPVGHPWRRSCVPIPPHVHADWDIHAVVRKMSDFNLTVAPVMDDDHLMIGVITVDDVLEMLLPTGWRRDFGMTAAEE